MHRPLKVVELGRGYIKVPGVPTLPVCSVVEFLPVYSVVVYPCSVSEAGSRGLEGALLVRSVSSEGVRASRGWADWRGCIVPSTSLAQAIQTLHGCYRGLYCYNRVTLPSHCGIEHHGNQSIIPRSTYVLSETCALQLHLPHLRSCLFYGFLLLFTPSFFLPSSF
ncbi:hypothetical protein VTK73DRAFT_1741 [Phialemonium thermophilum]|uniref:Uncharacterized protein n=1 Tax=Phialemonium thermophilum TaxID=223376 RepID=A0ABR3VT34_9PEZI